MKLFIFFLFFLILNSLKAKDALQSHGKILNALEVFLEKPVHDTRDPYLEDVVKNQEKAIPVFLSLLSQEDTRIKIKAWIAFFPTLLSQKAAEKFFPYLILALKEQNWQIKINAANTLGFFKVENAVVPLLELLQDKDELIKNVAEDALRKILNSSHIALVKQEFNKWDIDTQTRIVSLLGEIAGFDSRDFLIEVTKSKILQMQKSAIYYLGQNAKTASLLIPFLQDNNPEIRRISCLLLGRRKVESSLLSILQCLDDSDVSVRKAAIWAVVQLSGLRSIPTLQNFIKKQISQNDLSSMEIPEDLVTALMILGLQGDGQIFEYCKKILERNDVGEQSKGRILYGLSGIKNREAFFYIFQISTKVTPFLKKICAISLWKMSPELKSSDSSQRKTPFDVKLSKMPSIDTGRYVIYSDVGEDFLHDGAILMEYLHGYYHHFFSPIAKGSASFNPGESVSLELENRDNASSLSKNSKKPANVYIFHERQEFQEYAKEKDKQWPFLLDSRAYYVPARSEMLTYNREDENSVNRTLFHETLHQIFLHYVPDPPIWINEGLAEYFCNFEYKDGIYKTGRLSQKHLALLKKMLIEGCYTPVDHLIELNHHSFHNDNFGPKEMGNYAQSWSLVYFFMNADNGKYRNLTNDYLTNLFDGKKPKDAFEKVLAKHQLSMSILSQKWQAYFMTLPETHMSEYVLDDYGY